MAQRISPESYFNEDLELRAPRAPIYATLFPSNDDDKVVIYLIAGVTLIVITGLICYTILARK
jgi:hypothetical protein